MAIQVAGDSERTVRSVGYAPPTPYELASASWEQFNSGMALTDGDCWRIVELARAASGREIERQAELVVGQIRTRPIDEILRFNTWVRQRMEAACEHPLLIAVSWIFGAHDMGPVSGDTWEYFRGWRVARGRRHFEAVRANPDALADVFEEIEGFGDGEPLELAGVYAYWAALGGEPDLSIALYAYRRPTGAEEPDDLYEPSLIEHWPAWPAADELTPDKLIARFPKLYRRFGAPRLGF